MTKLDLQILMTLIRSRETGGEIAKLQFRRLGRGLLRDLAKRIGLDQSQYRLDYNPSGIAGYGEHMLHTDGLYVHVSAGACSDLGILYRTCRGRKDYAGGRNRWLDWAKLQDLDAVAALLLRTHQEGLADAALQNPR